MAEKTSIPLPLASEQYDQAEESFTRRTIEEALDDLNSEVGNLKTLHFFIFYI